MVFLRVGVLNYKLQTKKKETQIAFPSLTLASVHRYVTFTSIVLVTDEMTFSKVSVRTPSSRHADTASGL